MTTDKSSSPDHQEKSDLTADSAEPARGARSAESESVSDDLNRIASYLTEKRSTQSTRNQDLAEEIAHRRAESANQARAYTDRAGAFDGLAEDDDDLDVEAMRRHLAPRHRARPLTPNPILAERLDNFCRELDDMLENFRARIEYKNSVRH